MTKPTRSEQNLATLKKLRPSLARILNKVEANLAALSDRFQLIFARTNDHQNRITAVEATLHTFNESLHNHEKRLRDLAKTWVETKMATDYITNPACRPRDPLWVVMGYNSERMKVEVHGPFTYDGAREFCNDANYSGYAVLPLED